MNFEFVDIVQKILLVVSESNRLGKRSNKVSSSRGFGSTTDDAWTVCDLSTWPSFPRYPHHGDELWRFTRLQNWRIRSFDELRWRRR